MSMHAVIAAAVALAVVADEAKGPDAPIGETELPPDAVMFDGYGGNVTVVRAGGRIVMTDVFFPEAAPALMNRIQVRFGATPDLLVNTHAHADHIRGDAVAGDYGITTAAHVFTRQRVSERRWSKRREEWIEARPEAEWPTVTFETRATLHEGGGVELIHMPHAHTGGDTVVHFVDANVVAAGDIFWNGVWPIIDVDAGGSIDGVLAALDDIAALAGPEGAVVPGHGPASTANGVLSYRNALTTMRELAAAAIAAGEARDDFIARDPFTELQPDWKAWFVTSADVAEMVYDSLAAPVEEEAVEEEPVGEETP